MILDLKLSEIIPHMSSAVVECLYAERGGHLKRGDKLLDLSIDLSGAFPQSCPPISYFRMVAREAAWLRQIHVAPGDICEVGTLLATLSQEPQDEENGTSRPLRITTAGITFHSEMWSSV
jgi:hypothetical protein